MDRTDGRAWKFDKQTNLSGGIDGSDASVTIFELPLSPKVANDFYTWYRDVLAKTVVAIDRSDLATGSPDSPVGDFGSASSRTRLFQDVFTYLDFTDLFATPGDATTWFGFEIRGFSIGASTTDTAQPSNTISIMIHYIDGGDVRIHIDVDSQNVRSVTARDGGGNFLPLNSDGSFNTGGLGGFELTVPRSGESSLEAFINNYRASLSGECEMKCTTTCDKNECHTSCTLKNPQLCY